jgi:hypothetical protein
MEQENKFELELLKKSRLNVMCGLLAVFKEVQ